MSSRAIERFMLCGTSPNCSDPSPPGGGARAPRGIQVRVRGGGERGEGAVSTRHCMAAPLAEVEDSGVGRSLKRGGFSLRPEDSSRKIEKSSPEILS
jgi:hypothetical protein